MTAKFSDEELTAYLDGEADAALAASIASEAKAGSGVQKRLDDLTIDRDAILKAFDQLADTAPAMPALPGSAHKPVWKALAGVAAALLVGIGIGFGSRGSDAPTGWIDYVAAYQALYVNATLASLPTQDAVTDKNLERLSTILGRDLTLPDGPSALDYRRAQLLGFEGKPLVQIAFLSPVGSPVALCIITNEGPDQGVVLSMLEGMSTATWQKDGYGFMLIGGTDSELIRQEAERFSSVL